jgi:hypothetical protein
MAASMSSGGNSKVTENRTVAGGIGGAPVRTAAMLRRNQSSVNYNDKNVFIDQIEQ